MPAIRKPVTPELKGHVFIARIKHPVLKKTVCFSFGPASEAKTNLDAFHRIWNNPELWTQPPPPPQTPEKIYRQWMGRSNVVTMAAGKVQRGGRVHRADSDEVARLLMEVDALRIQLANALDRIQKQDRELEHWRGKKTTRTPTPHLEKARENFMRAYKSGELSRDRGRIPDPDAVRNIDWDLKRFCEHFGNNTPADYFEGNETKLSTWIHSLKNAKNQVLSATRRMQIRIYALMMLAYAGAHLDRRKVARPSQSKTTVNDTTLGGNGVINYLTHTEAAKVSRQLTQPWQDMFKVQCTLGLRPDELLTLHRNNFTTSNASLVLTPLVFEDHLKNKITLTLKTGPREIPVPESIRKILNRRLKACDVVFTDSEHPGFAWNDPKRFNRAYKAALSEAAAKAKLNKTLDSRIARRSCASWLIQNNVSAEKVAKLLGNSPEMILRHYGDPDVMALDLSQTEV